MTKRIDELVEKTNNRFHEAQKNQLSNDNTHESLKDLLNNYYNHCEETTKIFKQKMTYIEKELKENVLEHESFSLTIKETDSKLRKFIEETENKVEDIKKSIILLEKSYTKLTTLVNECNESNRKAFETFRMKVTDINKNMSSLSKEVFETKIVVNENKESDDKSLASINKKLSDIVEKKGNVNEQLNSMLYQLTNAEVAVEETNRNRVIENIIQIKGLY